MKQLIQIPIVFLLALCAAAASRGQSGGLPPSDSGSGISENISAQGGAGDEALSDPRNAAAEVIVQNQTFDDVIYNSYAFVFARCTGIVTDKGGVTRYRFDTIAHLAGGEMPEKFAVTVPSVVYYIWDSGTEYAPLQMEAEHYYILPLWKSISVFFDEYERYHLTSETLFETDADGNITSSKMQGRGIDTGISNVSGFKAFLERSEAVCSQDYDDIGTKYSTADDPEGIFRDSDYILEVEVIGINADFAEDRTSYDCRVLSGYKSIDDTDSIIDVITTKRAMEVGQKYIIAVNRVSKGSRMFVVSSRYRSVYPVDSPEAKEMIGLSKTRKHGMTAA